MVRELIRQHRWSLLVLYGLILAISGWAVFRAEQLSIRQGHLITTNRENIYAIRHLQTQNIKLFRRADYLSCVHFSNLLTSLIQPSVASLGKPGTPGYDYYLHHPEELKTAQAYNRKILFKADKERCKELPSQHAKPSLRLPTP